MGSGCTAVGGSGLGSTAGEGVSGLCSMAQGGRGRAVQRQGEYSGILCPIFAEIVPGKSRTSVYALDRSCESVLSSFAPPVVGLLAQHVYGYRSVDKGSSASEEIAKDRGNAASLAKALYTAIGVSMALCCLMYSFLYSTYPRDRERAQMEALTESEMLQIRLELPADGQHPHQVLLFESGEPYLEERTVIEPEKIGYGKRIPCLCHFLANSECHAEEAHFYVGQAVRRRVGESRV
ncbi:uncharacterized protein LOC133801000 [Humulus lupulus]|uniref:uncharacterized protein LOC133801000 n=1 Tax=Humulus lupulus TaxID=3486 RepID=UPI002B417B93|nr:uncharacterized protein LOC133801000 [Humulus lupulus]